MTENNGKLPSEYLPGEDEQIPKLAANINQAPILQFYSPDELRNYRPPADAMLVGDSHIPKGGVFVIGGAAGVGKSRASVALAVAGATGQEWFGLKVHRKFKTMIVQNENGLLRLSKEFSDISETDLNDYIRISLPPPFGLAFDHLEFRAALMRAIKEFEPDLVLIDPWNAVARDDNARHYLESYQMVRSLLTPGDSGPALGIIAHTRKPKNEESAKGRGLLNQLSGSYVLGSVPRAVFVVQAASEDPEDDRVVFTCCKNNDGGLGVPSAWRRKNGLFEPIPDFDWKSFRSPAEERTVITREHLAQLFGHGKRRMTRKHATAELQEQTGCGQSAAYNALSPKGRFADSLLEVDGLLVWAPSGLQRNSTESDGMNSIPPNPQGGAEMEFQTSSHPVQDQPST